MNKPEPEKSTEEPGHTSEKLEQTMFWKTLIRRQLHKRNPKKTEKTDNDELIYASITRIFRDATNYKEAIETADKLRWTEAIKQELKSMEDNNIWTFVDKPSLNENDQKVHTIDSKQVFRRKISDYGPTIHKGRLVIRGFKDRNEYELNKYNLIAYWMDVKTAFLN